MRGDGFGTYRVDEDGLFARLLVARLEASEDGLHRVLRVCIRL